VKLSHTRGNTTLEPGYDQGAGTYSFAATQRISKKSTLRASYDQKGKQASVEWSRQGSDEGGPIKVSCAMSHSLRNIGSSDSSCIRSSAAVWKLYKLYKFVFLVVKTHIEDASPR
jgi:hypothetical protein